jgi:hypothetical protein
MPRHYIGERTVHDVGNFKESYGSKDSRDPTSGSSGLIKARPSCLCDSSAPQQMAAEVCTSLIATRTNTRSLAGLHKMNGPTGNERLREDGLAR